MSGNLLAGVASKRRANEKYHAHTATWKYGQILHDAAIPRRECARSVAASLSECAPVPFLLSCRIAENEIAKQKFGANVIAKFLQ